MILRIGYCVVMMAVISLVTACTQEPASQGENGRWYSVAQVKQGETVFVENCAACHKADASGTSDWQKRDANGNYPPPPLNGSAHAWHHPLNILRMTVQRGGVPLGGQMPAFGDKLDATEIDAAIAYFQSKWNDDIYALWIDRHPDELKAKLGLN